MALSSPKAHNSLHEKLLALAIEQARTVNGRTSPNPPVGAVVAREGVAIGTGATQPPGGSHAERVALQAAGEAARGADLYVTLEPCTFHGRTPPCADAILAAGIRRVYYVARDPDPRIGMGIEVLRMAGIDVIHMPDPDGTVADLLAPFQCRTIARRPLVTAKYAMTLDGRIATVTGESRWISGSSSRREVHRLRDRVDVIMVGVGTILADDPQLTTRLEEHWRPVRHPLRVIVDSHGRTPLSARVLDPSLPGTTLLATVDPSSDWLTDVTARGAQVLQVPPDTHGRVSLPDVLSYLANAGANHVLVEGGSTLLGALAASKLIDSIWAFVAPKLLGGVSAPGPFGDPGVACMEEAHQFVIRHVARYDQDFLITATAAHAPWWQIAI